MQLVSFNPFTPSGLFYLYQLDESIESILGVSGVFYLQKLMYLLSKQCRPWSDAVLGDV